MAPHALTTSQGKSGSSSDTASIQSQFSLGDGSIKTAFGSIVDPESVKGSVYTTAGAIIGQSIYSVSSKIFSYEGSGGESTVEGHLQIWSQAYQRRNSFGVVPFFHRFEVRSGASNAILGYFSKRGTGGQPLSAIAGANTLKYMQPALSSRTSDSLPLSFNISAIDFDMSRNVVISNYASPLSVARSLNFPVLTPVDLLDGVEMQHLATLNHYIAFLTQVPSVYLFDGPEVNKMQTRFNNLLSVDELGELYEKLLGSDIVDSKNVEDVVDHALTALNNLTGKSYSQFEYVGDENAKTVFVVYGTNVSTQLSNTIKKLGESAVGLIKVRVPLPFNQEKFVKFIPRTTQKLVILDQQAETASETSSSLKADVAATLFMNGLYHSLEIEEFVYQSNFNWTLVTSLKVLSSFETSLDLAPILEAAGGQQIDAVVTANSSPSGKYLIWGADNGILMDTANKLALSLSLDTFQNTNIRTKYDNVSEGGIFQAQIQCTASKDYVTSIDSADIVLIEDVSLLSHYDILATVKPGGDVLLINSKTISTSVEEDIIPKLPVEFRRNLAKNSNKLTLIDFSLLEEIDKSNNSTEGLTDRFLVQLAFWRVAFPQLEGFIVNKLLQANGNEFELLASVLDKFINVVDEKNALKEVKVLPEWISLEDEVKEANKEDEGAEATETSDAEKLLPFFIQETSFHQNPRNVDVDKEEVNHKGYLDLATKITFPEAYQLKKDLRPDLSVKNFVVKVQENKRLTPSEYSRNIFHIEFDTTGTGLTYDIGEALGIHGRNSPEKVEEFLQFYNIDGDSLIEVSNKDDASLLEIRSARQALTDNLDFLGKPPKRFYESLAEFATDEKEQQHLQKLASGEGAEELKKRQEVEFSTYSDILEEFKSARPGFQDLVQIIAPLKRREYSIASSQRIHTNAVHLLIVVVDWVDAKGRVRFGQCSKYLSELSVGDELVVSVKPSVMKLPPHPKQPIVMSGLGTGLAPFKAFIEEKIWQKQQGFDIGEIYLYMGSRHKKEEYLYGELWEAYRDAGILTHIGAAFSRDQPQKIYIQDKIRESIEDLTDAIVSKNGSFYLCGPTWPVPDITACLEDIVANGAEKAGEEIKDVAKAVEDMKEDGRYILEVY